jgi:hypothetical protein
MARSGASVKPTRAEQYVKDVEFIFQECVRFAAYVPERFKEIPHEDLSCTIPHPDGKGELICGREAYRRIERLAAEALRRANLASRVEFRAVLKPVAKLLGDWFLKEKRSICVQQIDRLLSAVAKVARRNCIDTIHLIPCHLMLAKDPDEIPIGPVTFLNRAATRRLLLERVKGYGNGESPKDREFSRRLMLDAIRYYRSFNWIARVEIRDCDKKTSEALANRAVTSALDSLHLVLGARWTNKMTVGGPGLRNDRRGQITITCGKVGVSVSLGGPGQGNFLDGWSKRLEQLDYQRPLLLAGIALEAAVNPDLERPLSRRFLDAAQWFGEASRDPSPSTRIVKCVTALERMLMTEEHDDITRLVSARVAALCFDAGDAKSHEDWRQRAATAYNLRSKLVHGSLSPLAPVVRVGTLETQELAEDAVIAALHAFGEEGLRAEAFSTRKLGEWFGGLIEWAQQSIAAKVAP